ncbi:MAG TPA: hypothetical protein VIH17_02115 [Candidatus Acidoferrales bacterium]
MDETKIDRQVFVTQRGNSPRPAASIVGPLLLVAVLGVVGFTGYRYVRANGIPEIGGGNPDRAQIVKKLEEIEKRLDQLEKRRKTAAPESATAAAKTEPAVTKSLPSLPASPPPSRALSISRQPASTPAATNPATDSRLSKLQQEVNTFQSDVAANREAWEATSNRLGDTVGELGSQRGEIARTREGLEQLSKRFERIQLPFQLRRKMGRQRIGSVWMELKSTDLKKQRYTMAVFAEEKWIEMKDRALQEQVEFYVSGFAFPLEMVVSEIRQNEVVGYLALPKEGAKR